MKCAHTQLMDGKRGECEWRAKSELNKKIILQYFKWEIAF